MMASPRRSQKRLPQDSAALPCSKLEGYGTVSRTRSNSDLTVYHELGTSHISPRSFLVGVFQHMEE